MIRIYELLLEYFGLQGWWPVNGRYDPEKKSFSRSEKFEIMAGAILTQNTAWNNVERALANLRNTGFLTPEAIAAADLHKLEQLIRPSGFFKQKARRLQRFAEYIFKCHPNFEPMARTELLALDGIGPETADSIMLYVFDSPYFIADAYTRRFISRYGVLCCGDYEAVRDYFEKRLPPNPKLFQEYHALIVALAKRFCRKKPDCFGCPLARSCKKIIN